jgi:hypothetical protein
VPDPVLLALAELGDRIGVMRERDTRLRRAAWAVVTEWKVRGDGGCSKNLQDLLREALDG